jgi:hypothetical protein
MQMRSATCSTLFNVLCVACDRYLAHPFEHGLPDKMEVTSVALIYVGLLIIHTSHAVYCIYHLL